MILFITNNYCLSNKYALNAVKVNLKMKKVFVLNYFYSKKIILHLNVWKKRMMLKIMDFEVILNVNLQIFFIWIIKYFLKIMIF